MSNESGLYHFNPTCELAIGNGSLSYTPPAYLQQFEHELGLIQIYLSTQNDYLLLNENPSPAFIDRLKVLKSDLPQFGLFADLLNRFKGGERLDSLNPWGWSPVEHKLLSSFKKYCSKSFHEQPNNSWKNEHRNLYGRPMALQVLNLFLNQQHNKNHYIPFHHLPRLVKSIDEVLACQQEWVSVVVKAPWSSSGRGLIVLNKGGVHATYKQWINGVIKSQGFVMCEPYFKKCCDISFHFSIESSSVVSYLGQVASSTDERGQFIGCYLQSQPTGLNANLTNFLNEQNLTDIALGLQAALKNCVLFHQYHGILGIDVLVYEDEAETLRFNPCMEINLRQNMGTVTLALRSLFHVEASGFWQIKKWKSAKNDTVVDFDQKMQNKYPVVLKDGKIFKGYMPLVEPLENSTYAVYLIAE